MPFVLVSCVVDDVILMVLSLGFHAFYALVLAASLGYDLDKALENL